MGTLALVGGTGCGDATGTTSPDETSSTSKPKDPLATGSSFAALTRDVTPDIIGQRERALVASGANKAKVDSSSSFYLAISKKSLNQKWFLSTFITQFFPGAVSAGAARSMGTRIVSFQVQNGKLFMFDASSNNATSGTFNPQVLLDAYPIVTDNAALNASANAKDYVIVDPSSGLNKFNLFSDWFGGAALPMNIDVSFLQNFRLISDGATWEQVFTGTSNAAISDGTVDSNVLRASGTLGMSLRHYSEGTGFTETQLPRDEYFFRSDSHIVPNSGGSLQTAAKWNIYKGMKPITWKIAHNVLDVQNDPYFGQYDIVGSLKGAIESWNQVFGFEALKAEIATETDSAGNDDTNYVLFDEDPSYGAAFANWRSNPNTGEIRGASVYFSSLWLWEADGSFSDDPGLTKSIKGTRPAVGAAITAPRKAQTTPMIGWQPMAEKPLCMMWAPQYSRGGEDSAELAQALAAVGTMPAGLTKKAKVEALLLHILAHEIGHTLGLRHNFKGSLIPPTSSVMDYTGYEDAAKAPGPQAYDNVVVKLLYGLGTDLPTQPFCTDDSVGIDPDCTPYDVGADPLTETYGKAFSSVKAAFLAGTSAVAPNTTANNLLKYVRAGTPAQAEYAWKLAFDGISAPINATLLSSSPVYGAAADALSKRLLTRMWSDDVKLRGSFKADPPRTAFIMINSLNELSGNLNNLDGVRSFANRRSNVDVLKYFQIVQAYQILSDAKAKIAYDSTKLSGTPLLLTQDLAARIDSAITPYFVK